MDDQTSITIKVYQGERHRAEENRLLCSFLLTNIPPASAGVLDINVSFEIGYDRTLRVSARDAGRYVYARCIECLSH